MKFGPREAKVQIFKSVDDLKVIMAVTAQRFPKDAEAYLALDPLDRMLTADDLIRNYCDTKKSFTRQGELPNSHRAEEAGARVTPEDYPAAYLDAVVNRQVSSTHGSKSGLFVRVQAVDQETELKSRWLPFGGLVGGPAIIGKGGYSAILEPDGNWDGRKVPMEDEEAADIIEFVDLAAIGLLEGIVQKHRQFAGVQAVARAAEVEAVKVS